MYALRKRVCPGCGIEQEVRHPPSKPWRCIECTLKIMTEAAVSMASKSGDYYDRWLKTRGPLGRPCGDSQEQANDEAR